MSKVGIVRRKISPPKLVLIHSPSEPIKNGKNRRKFPSFKDCNVKIAVTNSECTAGSKQNRVPIRYECDANGPSMFETTEKNSLANRRTYLLGVSSITRHATNEEVQLPDLPTHIVCQHQPINYCTVKDIPLDQYGFWFRFFGKPCRFHITITLKLHKNITGHIDKVVSTIELDIRNIMNTINRNISMKSSIRKSRGSSLYSEKVYISIMEKLQNLQAHCLWEKCVSVGAEILSGLEKGKSDFKVCILLEQSKAVCHLGKFAAAKLLVKESLEAIPTKSQNKDLLIARAYMYLSLCHHYDFSLGSTEECLRIAGEKLIDFKPCEDTADLHYNEGRLLLSFLLKVPNFNHGLIREAKDKLEKAIAHFQESCNCKHAIIINKIYNTQLYVAILLLLANPEKDGVIVAEKIISTLYDTRLSLFQETKCRFSFVQALMLKHKCSNEAAITNAKHALELAQNCGLYLEEQLIVKCLKSLKYM